MGRFSSTQKAAFSRFIVVGKTKIGITGNRVLGPWIRIIQAVLGCL